MPPGISETFDAYKLAGAQTKNRRYRVNLFERALVYTKPPGHFNLAAMEQFTMRFLANVNGSTKTSSP